MEQQNIQEINENLNYGSETESAQYLTFMVNDGTYGIKVSNVKEVIGYNRIFTIPRVPEYIRGIINLRGEVIPVIDLNRLFFKRTNDITKFTSIIILEIEQDGKKKLWGMLIDSVQSVFSIADDNIEESPDFSLNLDYYFVSSVASIDDNFIILLNVDKIIDQFEVNNI